MPTYRSPDGTLYWFEVEADPAVVRSDLVLLTDEEEAAIEPPPPAVPDAITMRQARLALLGAGLLATVDAAIDGLPSPQREAAWIEWEYAAEVRRDSAMITMLAPALGLSDTQVDELFIAASGL